MDCDKPKILDIQTVAESTFFRIESVGLRFQNGNIARFERLTNFASNSRAVVVIPVIDSEYIVFIREYAVGIEDYVLRLPQGMPELGETVPQTANRELMEEIGYGSRHLYSIGHVHLVPNLLPYRAEIVIAENLYPKSLTGDEPELLRTTKWPIDRLDDLTTEVKITEAGSLASLFLAHNTLLRLNTPDSLNSPS